MHYQNSHEFVILLHGLGRTKMVMEKLERHLLKQGYAVWNKSYPSRKYPIEELAGMAVEPAIQFARNQGAKKIHIVGHSLGGVLSRYYLQYHPVKELDKLVLIGAPNHGSKVADWLKDCSIVSRMMGPVLSQLTTDEYSVPNQIRSISATIGCIAGTKSSDPWFSWFMNEANDGKVTVNSAKLEGMRDFITLHRGHTLIPRCDDTIAQVTFFLQHARFDHSGN